MILCFLSEDPGWGSCSLGVFICLDCSGIHRNIPDISKIKSLSLSHWEDHEVQVRQQNRTEEELNVVLVIAVTVNWTAELKPELNLIFRIKTWKINQSFSPGVIIVVVKATTRSFNHKNQKPKVASYYFWIMRLLSVCVCFKFMAENGNGLMERKYEAAVPVYYYKPSHKDCQ